MLGFTSGVKCARHCQVLLSANFSRDNYDTVLAAMGRADAGSSSVPSFVLKFVHRIDVDIEASDER